MTGIVGAFNGIVYVCASRSAWYSFGPFSCPLIRCRRDVYPTMYARECDGVFERSRFAKGELWNVDLG